MLETHLLDFSKPCKINDFYFQEPWLELLSILGARPLLLALEKDGEVVGKGIFQPAKFWFLPWRKPWATPYTVAALPGREEATLRYFAAELRRRSLAARLVLSPHGAQAGGMTGQHGATTFVLPLQDLGLLWQRAEPHMRQRVRKAERLGVSVAESAAVDSFFPLHRATYARQGMVLKTPAHCVTAALQHGVAAGLLRYFEARTPSGEVAAALVVAQDELRCYFLLAASHPELRRTDAVSLLWWQVMQECAKTHPLLDLVGTGTPGIARFKRSFSPEVLPVVDLQITAPGCRPLAWLKGWR